MEDRAMADRLRARIRPGLLAACLAALSLCGAREAMAQSSAQAILDSFKTVTVPPPPKLEPAAVDGAHTALIFIDFTAYNCTLAGHARCFQTIPNIQHLLADARAHHMMVVYCFDPPTPKTPAQAPEAVVPRPGEPVVFVDRADKFAGAELDKTLAAKGIQSVVLVGQTSQSAVLYTASSAALRNLNVVVPIDGISSHDAWEELYALWHLKNGAGPITKHITLTSTDQITIR
jgi:nicotinamidase-related amidase